MNKTAKIVHGVMPAIEKRWSPLAFSDRPIEREKLLRIFEAGQWAPSSYNEQPWRFILGQKGKGTTWNKLLDTCSGWNQKWAREAPVLVLLSGKKRFTMKDMDNVAYAYDVGAVSAYMTMQLTEEGLFSHQMVGFSPEKAREIFGIPEGFDPLVVIAIGYLGDHDTLPEDMAARETQERTRKPLSTLIFDEAWGNPSELVK